MYKIYRVICQPQLFSGTSEALLKLDVEFPDSIPYKTTSVIERFKEGSFLVILSGAIKYLETRYSIGTKNEIIRVYLNSNICYTNNLNK